MDEHTIFIVDEHLQLGEQLSTHLAARGFRTHLSYNENEAVELIMSLHSLRSSVDLLLCVMNGPTVPPAWIIERLRHAEITIPFLVITSHADEELLMQLLNMGCRGIIKQPVEPVNIENHVALLINELSAEATISRRPGSSDHAATLTEALVHDLNNMLQGCIGLANLASMELPDEHPARESAGRLIAALNESMDIGRKLLALRRGERSGLKTRADVRPAIERCAAMLRTIVPGSITVNTMVNAAPCYLYIDLELFQEALFNIGINAIQAMTEGGNLTIAAAWFEEPGYAQKHILCVTVTDTGRGIAAEDMPKLFITYFTAHSPSGTIGLSIVKRFMEHHHGWFRISSVPGRGTEFKLFIPTPQPVTGFGFPSGQIP